MKDYDLHNSALVRDNFYALDGMKEVKRVIVMGYAAQNPYLLEDAQMYGRQGMGWRDKEMSPEEKRKHKEKSDELMNQSAEGRTGKLIDIDEVIEKSDALEEEKMRVAREKKWKENESLISGEMV